MQINRKMKNKILLIHAAWLFENGYYDECIECLSQAIEYSQDKDLRQTNGYLIMDTIMNVLTAYNKHQLTVKVMTGDKQN